MLRTFEIQNLCQLPAQWRMQENPVCLAERNEEVSHCYSWSCSPLDISSLRLGVVIFVPDIKSSHFCDFLWDWFSKSVQVLLRINASLLFFPLFPFITNSLPAWFKEIWSISSMTGISSAADLNKRTRLYQNWGCKTLVLCTHISISNKNLRQTELGLLALNNGFETHRCLPKWLLTTKITKTVV